MDDRATRTVRDLVGSSYEYDVERLREERDTLLAEVKRLHSRTEGDRVNADIATPARPYRPRRGIHLAV